MGYVQRGFGMSKCLGGMSKGVVNMSNVVGIMYKWLGDMSKIVNFVTMG